MKRYWQYFKYVIRHKWYVFLACAQYEVPLSIAILHDWDKFLPSMFIGYARCFYKSDGSGQYDEDQLSYAWNAHMKRNKHHWQYWLMTWDDGRVTPLEMPSVYVREMLADWAGAGLAIGKTDVAGWYEKNKDKMTLHPKTRSKLEMLLFSKYSPYIGTYKR